ncbi:protein kinase domain-containing protein [Rubritalea tangerina]|uniref:Protein kinase n=1 Tax=Rubritalea tangerina TaxID=430798 RepID=A0ABW4Z5Z6_9BACT
MKERHQIIKQLGAGGFGSVYLARDTQLDRDVAIKRLKAENYADHLELKEQLLTEAKVLAGLRHPNIVSIFDVIETDTGGDIIMELIEGETLDSIINEKPLTIEQFLFVSTQLLSAIATAHEHNIIHCDLKPSNVMLVPLENDNYQATVLDFGLSPSKEGSTNNKKTNQKLVGSIYFMAPELLEAGITSKQSDIYSMGCLFYYMLTGKHPFDGDSPVIIMASHMRNAYTPIQELLPEIPESLASWIADHIKYDPDARVQTCRDSLNKLLKLEGIKPLETFAEAYEDSSLNNTMLHSLSSLTKASVKLSKKQQEEFEKSKKNSSAIQQQPMTALADRVHQARPQDLWYFSIDDVRKGPVPFAKVCELIAEGFIRSNDPIYHHRIGEWTPAVQIPEFKEEFQSAKAMPPRPKRKKKVSLRNSQRIRAQKAAAKAAQIKIEQEDPLPFPLEIVTTVVLSSLTLATITWSPFPWQSILTVSAFLFFITGLIIARIRMNQDDPRWLIPAIFIPIVTDLLYAIFSPKEGLQAFVMTLLGIAFFVYCSLHRTLGDFLEHTGLGFLSRLINAI